MPSVIPTEVSDEIRSLMDQGFEAAWIRDLCVGDIFAGPRLFEFDPPRQLFVVEELFSENADYIDEDDEFVQNRVINMIVRDENDLQRHLAYGHTHDIYIWRG